MIRRFCAVFAASVTLAAGAVGPAAAKPHHPKPTGGIATTDAGAYASDVNYYEPAADGGGDDGSVAIVAVSGGAVLILGIAAFRRRRPASA